MSTIKTTNLQHPSAASPNLVLAADGSVSGGAGLGGLVLVSPTSIANSGGSASASGGAVTFTGVSSMSLNGVFTSSYENYQIVLEATASAGNNLSCRLRASGTDATGSNYDWQLWSVYATSFAAAQTLNTDSMRISWITSTDGILAIISVSKPQVASATRFLSQAGGAPELNIISGDHDSSTSYDGITFLPQSGNTITGTIRVYGYKNS